MRRPDFITFTGVDDRTPLAGLLALSNRYPIEWGVLFSPTRQGIDNRYPGGGVQSALLWNGLKVAAHLCGGYACTIMDGGDFRSPIDLGICSRVQINHSNPCSPTLQRFQRGWGTRCIAQSRGPHFPGPGEIDWLHDASGGRGIEALDWPPYPGRCVGYAGGIGPDNVLAVIDRIGAAGSYWLDMESKVRTDDWFDLAKVEAVCRAVYGEGQSSPVVSGHGGARG